VQVAAGPADNLVFDQRLPAVAVSLQQPQHMAQQPAVLVSHGHLAGAICLFRIQHICIRHMSYLL
jgi:hypothetical protein